MPRRAGRGPGPGVVAVALAAAPARAGLPRRGGDQPGQRRDGDPPPGAEADREVHRDREHVALPGVLAGGPQLRAAAVHLVPGRPAERHRGVRRPGDHVPGQLGLGLEHHVSGDLGPLAPPAVPAPGLRQVEPEIKQRVPAGGDIRAVHHGLAVLHLAGDPRVLAGRPHRHLPLLQLRGLIDHQHRARIAQVIYDQPLQGLQRRLPVPGVLGQQRLQTPRRGMPRLLGELPARPAVPRLGQRRPEVSERGQPRPGLGEHRREQPAQVVMQFPQPAAIFYDGRSGHLLILSSHKA